MHTIQWHLLGDSTEQVQCDDPVDLLLQRAEHDYPRICVSVNDAPWSEFFAAESARFDNHPAIAQRSSLLAHQIQTSLAVLKGSADPEKIQPVILPVLVGLAGWEKPVANADGWTLAGEQLVGSLERAANARGTRGPAMLGPEFWVSMPKDLTPAVVIRLLSNPQPCTFTALHPKDVAIIWPTIISRRFTQMAGLFAAVHGPQLGNAGFSPEMMRRQIDTLRADDTHRQLLHDLCTSTWLPDNRWNKLDPLHGALANRHNADNTLFWTGRQPWGKHEAAQPTPSLQAARKDHGVTADNSDLREIGGALTKAAHRTQKARPRRTGRDASTPSLL